MFLRLIQEFIPEIKKIKSEHKFQKERCKSSIEDVERVQSYLSCKPRNH